MKSLLKSMLIITLLMGCVKEDLKTKEILNFLDNTLYKYDEKEVKIISIELIDTVFVTDYHTLKMQTNLQEFNPSDEGKGGYVDTISMTSDSPSLTDINWEFETFSRKLHEAIRKDDTDYVFEDNKPNTFMNEIVKSSYMNFEEKFLKDGAYQANLFKNINLYDGFESLANVDTFKHYINLEKQKSRQVKGFLYRVKYRYKTVLAKYNFLFSPDYKLLEFEAIND